MEELLGSAKRILGVIKQEILGYKNKFCYPRKTQVFAGAVDKFTQEDLIPNEATVVILTHDGYIKRLPPDTFKLQGRGGKGVIGLSAKEEDAVEEFIYHQHSR